MGLGKLMERLLELLKADVRGSIDIDSLFGEVLALAVLAPRPPGEADWRTVRWNGVGFLQLAQPSARLIRCQQFWVEAAQQPIALMLA